jgi:hypothetical protein
LQWWLLALAVTPQAALVLNLLAVVAVAVRLHTLMAYL